MALRLIETGTRKSKGIGSTFASIVIHALIVVGSVIATKHVGEAVAETVEAVTEFVVEEEKKEEEPKPEEPPPDVAAPPLAKGFQVLTAPVEIPDVIPEIDLNAKVTNEADFSGRGVAGGVATGVVGGVVAPNADQAYFDFQVEKPVAPIPGSGAPRYPDILRSAGVEGEVLAQFVVDTLGRVDISSYKVIRTSHELFATSLRAALPAMRFMPAEVGGRKVKQLVQQPFVFALQR
ncbi:MAG: TonB family protein [Gemmatimonadetes bacterium]|nr:TonB family protein [Gemmatimonadota bacterium]